MACAVAALAIASLGDSGRGEAQPLDLGEENSWLRIQNVGRRAATVEIDFFDLAGALAGQRPLPSGRRLRRAVARLRLVVLPAGLLGAERGLSRVGVRDG